jgi:hypothetical protein
MADRLELHTLYRTAYGYLRWRLEQLPVTFDPADFEVDPAEAVGRPDPATLADPEVAEAIRDGIADARAKRWPRR